MKINLPKTLTFRLTTLYAGLFTVAFILVFSIVYYIVQNELLKMMDQDLMEDISDMNEIYEKSGLDGLERFVDRESSDDGPENKCFRIIDAKGRIIHTTDLEQWGNWKIKLPPSNTGGEVLFKTIRIPVRSELKARVMTFPIGQYWIEVAVPLKWNGLILSKLRKAFWLGGIFTMFFSILTGWIMARRTLSKIQEIDYVARKIANSNDLSQRVPLKGTGDELDRLAATFNSMLERLEAFVRELSDMLDNTAHDFKTPLARIRAMAETSLASNDVDSIQEVLVEIINESDRFLSVLNAIMDISEARTGLLDLKPSQISIYELLRELEGLFSGIAKAKSIRFNVAYPERDLIIRADRAKLFQALLNIVDNAFKFTPPGGTVAIWLDRDDQFVKISVSDTGPGIPQDKISRIFERFFRLDSSRSSQGRGIGLALAKAFIEAHGGRIHVESYLNSGSTFSVWIPLNSR